MDHRSDFRSLETRLYFDEAFDAVEHIKKRVERVEVDEIYGLDGMVEIRVLTKHYSDDTSEREVVLPPPEDARPTGRAALSHDWLAVQLQLEADDREREIKETRCS